MHTIKITRNLLFEYQCTSGKFIRLPNRIETFLPELECSSGDTASWSAAAPRFFLSAATCRAARCVRAGGRCQASLVLPATFHPQIFDDQQDSPARPSCHASCVHSPYVSRAGVSYKTLSRHAAALCVTATRAGKPCCVRRGLSSCRSDGRFNSRSHYALIRASAV